MMHFPIVFLFFFLKDPAPPEISPLPLHDALPIPPAARGERVACRRPVEAQVPEARHTADRRHQYRATERRATRVAAERDGDGPGKPRRDVAEGDRKSTRLNSSHLVISYAVFCLKK